MTQIFMLGTLTLTLGLIYGIFKIIEQKTTGKGFWVTIGIVLVFAIVIILTYVLWPIVDKFVQATATNSSSIHTWGPGVVVAFIAGFAVMSFRFILTTCITAFGVGGHIQKIADLILLFIWLVIAAKYVPISGAGNEVITAILIVLPIALLSILEESEKKLIRATIKVIVVVSVVLLGVQYLNPVLFNQMTRFWESGKMRAGAGLNRGSSTWQGDSVVTYATCIEDGLLYSFDKATKSLVGTDNWLYSGERIKILDVEMDLQANIEPVHAIMVPDSNGDFIGGATCFIPRTKLGKFETVSEVKQKTSQNGFLFSTSTGYTKIKNGPNSWIIRIEIGPPVLILREWQKEKKLLFSSINPLTEILMSTNGKDMVPLLLGIPFQPAGNMLMIQAPIGTEIIMSM